MPRGHRPPPLLMKGDYFIVHSLAQTQKKTSDCHQCPCPTAWAQHCADMSQTRARHSTWPCLFIADAWLGDSHFHLNPAPSLQGELGPWLVLQGNHFLYSLLCTSCLSCPFFPFSCSFPRGFRCASPEAWESLPSRFLWEFCPFGRASVLWESIGWAHPPRLERWQVSFRQNYYLYSHITCLLNPFVADLLEV